MHQVAKTEGDKKGETMGEPGEVQRRADGEDRLRKRREEGKKLTKVASRWQVTRSFQYCTGNNTTVATAGSAFSSESLNRIVVWSSGEKNGGKMVVQPTALLVPTRLAEWDGVEDYFQGLEEVPKLRARWKGASFVSQVGARMIEQISSDWSAVLSCRREESQRLAGWDLGLRERIT